MVSEKAIELVSGVDELSVTMTVKLVTAAVFAVPEIVPSAPRPIPPGGCPSVRVQVYGRVPPDADSAKEYGVLTTPCGKGLVLLMVTWAARPERNVNPSTSDFVTMKTVL